MKTHRAIFILATLPALLFAQNGKISRRGNDWVEEISGNITATPRFKVETPGGQVEVRGGTGSQISYRCVKVVRARNEEEARRKFATAQIQMRRAGDRAELSLEQVARRSEVGADFFVTVPKSIVQVRAETAGGGVLVENIDGEAIAITAGGDVHADQIGSGAKLETAGGHIFVGQVRGMLKAETAGGNINVHEVQGESQLQTTGGNIDIENSARTVRASSAGGDVRIRRCGGDVRVETGGGTIRVGAVNGIVVAETGGGGIEVESARAVVRAESGSGAIKLGRIAGPIRAETAVGNVIATFVADRNAWAESMLGTVSGDVVVYLPANLSVTIQAVVDAAPSRQAIHSDFPLIFKDSGFQVMQQLIGEVQVNGGGPPLKIHTGTGKIQIIKVNSK